MPPAGAISITTGRLESLRRSLRGGFLVTTRQNLLSHEARPKLGAANNQIVSAFPITNVRYSYWASCAGTQRFGCPNRAAQAINHCVESGPRTQSRPVHHFFTQRANQKLALVLLAYTQTRTHAVGPDQTSSRGGVARVSFFRFFLGHPWNIDAVAQSLARHIARTYTHLRCAKKRE